MNLLCRILGHRWRPMLTLPADLCPRCNVTRLDHARAAARRAQLLRVAHQHPPFIADHMRRVGEAISSGDCDGYVALMRETDR